MIRRIEGEHLCIYRDQLATALGRHKRDLDLLHRQLEALREEHDKLRTTIELLLAETK